MTTLYRVPEHRDSHPYADLSDLCYAIASPDPTQAAHLACEGMTVHAWVEHDGDAEAPWDAEGGHGDVRSFGVRGHLPRGWVDISPPNVREVWGYDFSAAMVTAMRDKWGVDPAGYKQAARAHKARTGKRLSQAQHAVRDDMGSMRQYLAQDWSYTGVTVALVRDDEVIADDSLWGVAYGHPCDPQGAHMRGIVGELVERLIARALAAPVADLPQAAIAHESRLLARGPV